MVTVNGKRHLVGLSGDQWYVLDVAEGTTENCANYATARVTANERNRLVKPVTTRRLVGGNGGL